MRKVLEKLGWNQYQLFSLAKIVLNGGGKPETKQAILERYDEVRSI